MEKYEREQLELSLFVKLAEGEASVQNEVDWLTTEALRKKLEV